MKEQDHTKIAMIISGTMIALGITYVGYVKLKPNHEEGFKSQSPVITQINFEEKPLKQEQNITVQERKLNRKELAQKEAVEQYHRRLLQEQSQRSKIDYSYADVFRKIDQMKRENEEQNQKSSYKPYVPPVKVNPNMSLEEMRQEVDKAIKATGSKSAGQLSKAAEGKPVGEDAVAMLEAGLADSDRVISFLNQVVESNSTQLSDKQKDTEQRIRQQYQQQNQQLK